MIRRHATVADFTRWEEQAASMTDAELIYAARDCRKVEALWRGVDGMVEGFYSDQAATFGTELRRRRASR
jgi:transposase-like protein